MCVRILLYMSSTRSVLILLYIYVIIQREVKDFYESHQTKSPSYKKGSGSKGSSFTGFGGGSSKGGGGSGGKW
jgi:uncharacterized membrane protein YgcG